MERKARSIVKAFSWRIIASVTTAALVFAFTGNNELALSVGFLDLLIKLGFYYAHERVWLNIGWGKESAQGSKNGKK